MSAEDDTKNLICRCDYYHEPEGRRALNAFVGKIFGGLDFSPWNDLGYPFPEYKPFSFFHEGQVVANVSASAMNLLLDGRECNAVQIGTVACDPAFRRRGLIRTLMQKVDEYWEPERSLFFLFANETVPTFYQQFGYRPVREYRFSAVAPAYTSPRVPAHRLAIERIDDRELLHSLAEKRAAVSARVGVFRQSWLLMFHAAVVYPQHLYYLDDLDVAIIAYSSGETLHLIDVIGRRIPSFGEIYPAIGAPQITKVVFSFTPDLLGIDASAVHAADPSELFVRGPFPDHLPAFRFPLTAQA
ncbi:MAG TPA: GNAT family N-acetyltransferase [bacterium]|nr:GNAT family N-acetyltransferase [bacterium]